MDESNGIEIQLRSEKTGMTYVRDKATWGEALKAAYGLVLLDKTIWKVSFTVHDTRHRLVRGDYSMWENRPFVPLDHAPGMSEEVQDIGENVKALLLEAGFKV